MIKVKPLYFNAEVFLWDNLNYFKIVGNTKYFFEFYDSKFII